MSLQGVDNVYDLQWAPGVKYREVRFLDEVQQSKYAFGQVGMPDGDFAAFHRDLFDKCHAFAKQLIEAGLVLPALDYCLKCSHLFNVLDASGYPDCRPAFVRAFQALAQVATRSGGFTIHAPLIELTKAEIIRLGVRLGVDYALTHSCYDPSVDVGGGRACGRCDACVLRRKGFAEAGVADPTSYV